MEMEKTKLKKQRVKKGRQSPVLGPIADLEKHLPSDWWKHLFNSVYLKTDADVVENENNTEKEISLVLELTKVKPSDHILDLCCGQGRHSLALAQRGFPHVSGVDRSRYLIRLARRRAIEKSCKLVQFKEGDARNVSFIDNSFDLVMVMGNSFGYFEREEENLGVLKEIYRLLNEGGNLFLDITDGKWMKKNYSPRSWEWIDQRMLVCRERTLSEDETRLITREVVIDAQKGIIADQFYAERVYTEEELKKNLETVGFSEVKIHSQIQAASTRAVPDLGMMANRLLITAKVQNKQVKKSRIVKATKLECSVLMGDPTLPDKVKLNSQFNKEDYETIHRLKEALGTLSGYQFYYLSDHEKFLSNLQSRRPSLVFNLCDEGFRNDAFLELHIPALLDMLKIPYTGASPACLAICYNKGLVTSWAKEMSIPTPEEIWIDVANFSAALPSEFPVLVKPVYGDSSIGITKDALIHNASELVNYFDYLRKKLPGIPTLIQEFLIGREFSVGLIGNYDSITPLPILEVDYSQLPEEMPPILGYESKWMPDSPYWSNIRYMKANLMEEQARELIDNSVLLFQRLECRDYARFDYRMDGQGKIKLLEANPNPGWCWDGKFNLMAQMAGLSYADLLDMILRAARERLRI